jgi:hypothetical protein
MNSFAEFWPYYLGEHANATCRRWHIFGTAGVLLTAGLVTVGFWPPEALWLMPLLGYGCAWIGHFVFEKNRPATFRHPLWSLIGDFRLFFLAVSGRLPEEYRRYGIPDKP